MKEIFKKKKELNTKHEKGIISAAISLYKKDI